MADRHPPNGGDQSKSEIFEDIDAARAKQYMLLATLTTRAPSQHLLDQLALIGGDPSPLGRAHTALASAAQATDQDRAGREFFNLFVGVGRGEVLPYASFYRAGFLQARPLSDVRADLARLGIARSEAVHEPEDHLGTLFEVMAGLIQRIYAADTSTTGDDAARDFFRRHIEPWAERAMRDMALAPSASFYRAVAELGRLWIEIETEAFSFSG